MHISFLFILIIISMIAVGCQTFIIQQQLHLIFTCTGEYIL